MSLFHFQRTNHRLRHVVVVMLDVGGKGTLVTDHLIVSEQSPKFQYVLVMVHFCYLKFAPEVMTA